MGAIGAVDSAPRSMAAPSHYAASLPRYLPVDVLELYAKGGQVTAPNKLADELERVADQATAWVTGTYEEQAQNAYAVAKRIRALAAQARSVHLCTKCGYVDVPQPRFSPEEREALLRIKRRLERTGYDPSGLAGDMFASDCESEDRAALSKMLDTAGPSEEGR
jgi:hypothetical protein